MVTDLIEDLSIDKDHKLNKLQNTEEIKYKVSSDIKSAWYDSRFPTEIKVTTSGDLRGSKGVVNRFAAALLQSGICLPFEVDKWSDAVQRPFGYSAHNGIFENERVDCDSSAYASFNEIDTNKKQLFNYGSSVNNENLDLLRNTHTESDLFTQQIIDPKLLSNKLNLCEATSRATRNLISERLKIGDFRGSNQISSPFKRIDGNFLGDLTLYNEDVHDAATVSSKYPKRFLTRRTLEGNLIPQIEIARRVCSNLDYESQKSQLFDEIKIKSKSKVGTEKFEYNDDVAEKISSVNSSGGISKVSQKQFYIMTLSRLTGSKVDETVAYLHYKLRSYESMAVLTRTRDVLLNYQQNLIAIYNQLGIPEVLVPKRTN